MPRQWPRAILSLWIIGLLVTPCAHAQRAGAMKRRVFVPPEMVASQSDLIVVAKVRRIFLPQETTLQIPGDLTQTPGVYQKYIFQVERVIMDRPARDVSTKALSRPEPMSMPAAAAANEEPRLIDVYKIFRLQAGEKDWSYRPEKAAPDKSAADKPAESSSIEEGLPAEVVPPIENGKSYLLVLYYMPMLRAYYLPENTNNLLLSTPENTATFAKASNPDAWAWGQAVDGLQIALLVEPKATIPRRGLLYLHGAVAVRNVSDKPRKFDIGPAQKPISITAQMQGKTVADDFYGHARKLRPGQPDHVTIAPAQVVFFDASGVLDYGMAFHLPLTEGKWELQAILLNAKDGQGRQGSWQGVAQSAPVAVEVHPVSAAATQPKRKLLSTAN